jgi:hypothetical protein
VKYLVGFLLTLFAVYVLLERQHDDARIAIERKMWSDSIAVLQTKADGTTTVYVRDTVRAVQWRTRYDTLSVTDTVVRDSVVYVNKQLADSTINSCTLALNSCGLALKAQADLTDGWRARALRAEAKRKRGLFDRCGLALGYGVTANPAGTMTHGVQGGISCKVWP